MALKENLAINLSKVYRNGIRVDTDRDVLLTLSAFSLALVLIQKVSINIIRKQVVRIYEIVIYK